MSQPKYQKLLLRPDFNPERKEIEVNTKISKFFRNCSTFSQASFIYDPELMKDGTSSRLLEEEVKQTGHEKKLK